MVRTTNAPSFGPPSVFPVYIFTVFSCNPHRAGLVEVPHSSRVPYSAITTKFTLEVFFVSVCVVSFSFFFLSLEFLASPIIVSCGKHQTETRGTMTTNKVEVSPEQMALQIQEAVSLFGCTELSAERSIARHPNDEEAWKAELRAKASSPCCLMNFSLTQVTLAQRLVKRPFLTSIFSALNRLDGDALAEIIEAEDYPSGYTPEERTVLDNLRKLRPFWLSERSPPVHIIHFGILPQTIPHDADTYEKAFQAYVMGEGIRHLVGLVTLDDNHVPFADYCNERLWRSSTSVMDQLHREQPLQDLLLDPRWRSTATEEQRTELLDKVWADDGVHAANFLGRSPSTSMFRRNKYLAQMRLQHCGLAHIRSVVAECFVDAVKRMNEVGLRFPVVCKPACGEASILVTLCEDHETLRHVFDLAQQQSFTRCFDNRTFVIEEYIDGDEYVVNTVTLKGKSVVTDVWQSFKHPKATVTHRLTVWEVEEMRRRGEEPLSLRTVSLVYDSQTLVNRPERGQVRQVIEYVLQCVDALGVKNRASHCEVRVDHRVGSRQYLHPVLIELNPRAQGSTPRSEPLVKYSQLSLVLYTVHVAFLALYKEGLFAEGLDVPLADAAPSIVSNAVDAGESLPWPVTPRLYRVVQESSDGSEQGRKVVFLNCPQDGILSFRGLKSLRNLPSFREYSRFVVPLDYPGLLRVTETSDLFSSPCAIVLQGTEEELCRDTTAIRTLEKKTWAPRGDGAFGTTRHE
eukprot:gene10554-7327_t